MPEHKVPYPQLFAAFAHDDIDKWRSAIGEIVEHKRLGTGEVVGVRQNDSKLILVSIAFSEDEQPTRELIPAAFFNPEGILDLTLSPAVEARISAEQDLVSAKRIKLVAEERERRKVRTDRKHHQQREQQLEAKRKERLAREAREREAKAIIESRARQQEQAELAKRQQLLDQERRRKKAVEMEQIQKRNAERKSLALQRRRSVKRLYYIAPINNLRSIVELGILSHDEIRRLPSRPRDISDPMVQARRDRMTYMGRRLHSYANLYFNPHNAMVSALRRIHMDICIIGICSDVLDLNSVVITNGNAASSRTKGNWSPEGLLYIDWDVMEARYWTDFDSEGDPDYGKWARMAEVLVPTLVPPQHIECIYASCAGSHESVRAALPHNASNISVVVNPRLFILS